MSQTVNELTYSCNVIQVILYKKMSYSVIKMSLFVITVIKNVKKAHQIQDSGEFQEFNDDVEYIMDGLKMKKNVSTRCLSTVTLATKCMEPSFRMHLRAHGKLTI